MRKGRCLFMLVGLLGPAVLLSAGCIDALADFYTPLTDSKLAKWKDGGGGAGGTGAGASSSTGTGATGGTGAPAGTPTAIRRWARSRRVRGVRLQSGSDTSAGTMAAPFKTMGPALDEGGAIYACAGAAPYREAVTVDRGVTLYGGLDCASWKYVGGKKTEITAGAGEVPVALASQEGGSGGGLSHRGGRCDDGGGVVNRGGSRRGATAEIAGCLLVGIESARAKKAAISGLVQPAQPYSDKAGRGAGMMGNSGDGGPVRRTSRFPALPPGTGCGTPDSTSGAGGHRSGDEPGGAGSPGLLGKGSGGWWRGRRPDRLHARAPSATHWQPPRQTPRPCGATGIGTIAAGGYSGVDREAMEHIGGVGPRAAAEAGARRAARARGCARSAEHGAAGASGGSGGSGGCGGTGGKGGAFGGSREHRAREPERDAPR